MHRGTKRVTLGMREDQGGVVKSSDCTGAPNPASLELLSGGIPMDVFATKKPHAIKEFKDPQVKTAGPHSVIVLHPTKGERRINGGLSPPPGEGEEAAEKHGPSQRTLFSVGLSREKPNGVSAQAKCSKGGRGFAFEPSKCPGLKGMKNLWRSLPLAKEGEEAGKLNTRGSLTVSGGALKQMIHRLGD